jgi:hypothetical protein
MVRAASRRKTARFRPKSAAKPPQALGLPRLQRQHPLPRRTATVQLDSVKLKVLCPSRQPAGSIAAFVMLAATMFATLRVNWSGEDSQPNPAT